MSPTPATLTPASTAAQPARRCDGGPAPVVALPVRRSLPVGFPVHPGESLDSWIEAVANRYETTTGVILDAVGLRTGSAVITTLQRLPAAALTDAARLAGLPREDLAGAAGFALPAAAWLPGCRSRYCPACLAETGGRWQLAWRAVPTATCPTHRLLLHDRCPACGAFPRVRLPGRPCPLHCTARLPDRSVCGADLTLAPTVAAGADLAGERGWASTLLAAAAHDGAAAATMTDLPPVLAWLERQQVATMSGLDVEPGRYRDAAATTCLLPDAATILGVDEVAAIAHIQALLADTGHPNTATPHGIGSATFTALTGPFPRRYRRAIDPHLNGPDRLRHRSATGDARRPTGVPAARVASIPELLWPDWYARLLPPASLLGDRARAAYANALLLPGLNHRRRTTATERLNEHRGPSTLSTVLRVYPPGTRTAVLAALTRLADHLDAHRPPIDYQRRRDVFAAAELLTWDQWRAMAISAQTHPGDHLDLDRTAQPRIVHARRYLHILLSGADLTNPRHLMAWRTPADRARYHQFSDSLNPGLRASLRRHGRNLLADAGIDEPLTWSPPVELADGLDLPGIDPATLDPDALLDITRHGQTVADVATRMGVHVDHIRLAIESHDPPTAPALGPTATARLHARDRAHDVATTKFFQRHYLQEGLGLRELEQRTGIPRRTLAEQARQHNIPLRAGREPLQADPGWLREQYLTLGRSTTDLAHEVGTTQMTMSRALRRAGIPLRDPGVHARREMQARLGPGHAVIVRDAVEGTLHGWLRLARFQAAMAYPTMKAAATHLELAVTALTRQVQRLETDTGARLYHRAAHDKPQRLTTHGHALLDALTEPATAAALRDATGPTPKPPDQATLERLRAGLTTRAPARPIAGYPGIDVQPLRRTAVLLAVLAHLTQNNDPDVWGYALAADLGLQDGTIYPLLQRLHHAGWITTRDETQAQWTARGPHRRGQRRRRYHRLTPDGRCAAEHILTTGSRRHPANDHNGVAAG